MGLRFIKLSERWFVDIPYDGSVDDLQMVRGADDMLERLSNGKFYAELNISTDETEYDVKMRKSRVDDFETGCYYITTYKESNDEESVWLCNVTKLVFGCFPDNIFITVLNEHNE